MAAVDDLNEVAAAFLSAATDALDLTPAGAPGRRYVSPGEPALDCCGQLTVWIQQLGDADLNAGPGALARSKAINRGGKPQVSIYIQATRCVDLNPEKAGGLPQPVLLEEAATTINRDGWALRCHLLWEIRHGDLAELCSGVEFLGGNVITPQGGCVGWTFLFRYPVEGGVLTT